MGPYLYRSSLAPSRAQRTLGGTQTTAAILNNDLSRNSKADILAVALRFQGGVDFVDLVGCVLGGRDHDGMRATIFQVIWSWIIHNLDEL